MRIELHYKGIKNANIAVQELNLNGFNTTLDLNDDYIDTNAVSSEMNFSSIMNYKKSLYNSHPGSPIVGGFGSSAELENTYYKVIVNLNSITKDNINKLTAIIKRTDGEIKSPLSSIYADAGSQTLS